MTAMKDLHAEWMKDDGYRQEFEALETEFAVARTMIETRAKAGLTQEELAKRMDTSLSAIARL